MSYYLTVGLEIHAELKTKTKMFCGCLNDPDEKRPNVNICPICLGHPGTLPVINEQAVANVIKVGLALGGQIADFTEFDRKNYFYPDIPKGYQISQYKYPIVSGGSLAGVEITRVHLEEDTARSQHDDSAGESLVDFNRAGVPLMELVTEPVIKNEAEAGKFARELQLLFSPEYLNVSEANMEKGELRVEANISVSNDPAKLGTKVEIKNLNSFRVVEKAIAYEFKRQSALLEAEEKVVQETRGWDENEQVTFSQRLKESSHDYRYFPDPDLPKLYLSQIEQFKNLASTIPELPAEKRERFKKDYGIKETDIEFLTANPLFANYFEEAVGFLIDKSKSQILANYLVSDLVSLLADSSGIKPTAPHFAKLIDLINQGKLSSRGAKDILMAMVQADNNPEEIAKKMNLFQESSENALRELVVKIINANQVIFADFKAGNDKVLQFLIGQAMKESKGSANPGVLAKLFNEQKNY